MNFFCLGFWNFSWWIIMLEIIVRIKTTSVTILYALPMLPIRSQFPELIRNYPTHNRNNNKSDGVEECFQSIILITVIVVCGDQCKEITVGPEEPKGRSHNKPGESNTKGIDLTQSHHKHH